MKERVREYLKKLDGIKYNEWSVLSSIINSTYFPNKENRVRDNFMLDYQDFENDETLKKLYQT